MRGLRSLFRRRRNRYIGVGAAVILVIGAGVGLYVGKDAHVPYSAGARVMMQFLASRDMGRLPSRSGWCTAVRSAEHCWLLQEDSGDATDTGATGGWDLTPAGSPRQGVHTPIPISGSGSVDTTTEKGVFFDNISAAELAGASVENLSTNLVSVTVLFQFANQGSTPQLASHRSGAVGWNAFVDTGGTGELRLYGGGTTNKTITGTADVSDAAAHCATIVADGRTASAAKVYLDGVDDTNTSDLSGTGSWTATTVPRIGNFSSTPATGGIYRERWDYAAITLAQHQQICGTLWAPPSNATNTSTKVAAANTSWTQTGGARCFASSATTALCAPGGSPTYAWTAALAGIGWPIEPDRTNRVLQSGDLSDAAWGGSATQSAVVAPDGSLTAWQAAYTDAVTTTQALTGYGVTATLFPRLWVKCSSGTFKINATVGAGQWDVNCTTIAGAWTDIHSLATAVTVNTAMASDGAGAFTWALASDGSGATVDVWMPTVTEVNGLSVIPTAGAAVATGAIAWEVDNSSGAYYNSVRGRIVYHADWVFEALTGTNSIYIGAATAGRWQVWTSPTSARMRMFDSSGVTLGWCIAATNPVDPPGVYDWEMRYNSTSTIPGFATYATTISNGAEDACADYTSTWTSANPSPFFLDGLNPHTSVLYEFRVEDRP